MAKITSFPVSPISITQFEWSDNYEQNKVFVEQNVALGSEYGRVYTFKFKVESIKTENQPEIAKISIIDYKSNVVTIQNMSFELDVTRTSIDQNHHTFLGGGRRSEHTLLEFKCGPFQLKKGVELSFQKKIVQAPSTNQILTRVSTKTILKVRIHQPCQSFQPSLDREVQKLCFSEDLSDIKIVCDGQTFPCHKVILGARSDVFKAMFSEPLKFKENQEGVLNIDDTNAETMKSFIYFVYNDTLTNEEITCQLLILADKYNLKRLVDVCAKHFMASITTDNVLEIIYTAYLVNSEELLTASTNFMAKNQGKIAKGSYWNEIQSKNPKIATKIIEKIFLEN